MKRMGFLIYLLLGAGPLMAGSVPNQITYQGTLKQSGLPATGNYIMQFQLTDGTTNTYWNSGNVPVSVNNGLFSAILSPTVDWQNLSPYIVVSVNGQTLSPPEPITSNAYALMSGSVIDGAITSAKIAPGAVTNTQIAAAAVNTVQIAGGAVTNAQIATGTIIGANIATGTITIAQLSTGTITQVVVSQYVNPNLTYLGTQWPPNQNFASLQITTIGGPVLINAAGTATDTDGFLLAVGLYRDPGAVVLGFTPQTLGTQLASFTNSIDFNFSWVDQLPSGTYTYRLGAVFGGYEDSIDTTQSGWTLSAIELRR